MENKIDERRKILADAEYFVNEKKRAVTCKIKSRGDSIYGVAKCSDTDKWDAEKGKEIASYRAEIAQRKRDLQNTESVIKELQMTINNLEYQVQHGFLKRSAVSRHWEHFLIEALDERKSQRENIKYCQKMIKILTADADNKQ